MQLRRQKNHTCHIRLLQQAPKHGLILKKIHRVIKFKQSNWIDKDINLNSKFTTTAKMNWRKISVNF